MSSELPFGSLDCRAGFFDALDLEAFWVWGMGGKISQMGHQEVEEGQALLSYG